MSGSDPVWPKDDDSDTINLQIYNQKFYRDFADETKFPEPNDTITWNQHIRGLFTEYNARCMISKEKSGASKGPPNIINLTSYTSVKKNDVLILSKLKSKKMPPGDPWSNYQIELFERWTKGGYQMGHTPSATDYDKKIIRAPLRYQYPETLPDDFIATFYQNVKHLFTECDQKFGIDSVDGKNYNVDVFDYNQLRDAAKAKEEKNNIIYDILHGEFPQGNPWPQTWRNVLDNWINNGCQKGVPPIGKEDI